MTGKKFRNGKFTLTIVACPNSINKIEAVKAVYHNTNLGLREFKDIIDLAQFGQQHSIIAKDLPATRAAKIRKELAKYDIVCKRTHSEVQEDVT